MERGGNYRHKGYIHHNNHLQRNHGGIGESDGGFFMSEKSKNKSSYLIFFIMFIAILVVLTGIIMLNIQVP